VSINLKDNLKELHNFIHLSKKCDAVHTPFSSKTQTLKLSCLGYVGVNFTKHRNFSITVGPIHFVQLENTDAGRELGEVIFTSCLAASFSLDTVVRFPL